MDDLNCVLADAELIEPEALLAILSFDDLREELYRRTGALARSRRALVHACLPADDCLRKNSAAGTGGIGRWAKEARLALSTGSHRALAEHPLRHEQRV